MITRDWLSLFCLCARRQVCMEVELLCLAHCWRNVL
jgi:hypothetical protein